MAPRAAQMCKHSTALTLTPRLALGRTRRRVTVCHGRSESKSFGSESLEQAVSLINRIIFDTEQKRQKKKAAQTTQDGVETPEVSAPLRPITFKASAKTEKLVKEVDLQVDSTRGLSAYLALPLDQYSLLDPGWISRPDPASPDVFVLRLPLFDLVGLELQPQISVRVNVDPRNNQVHFLADQFKVGDPRFDEDFKLNMKATLRNKPVPTLRPFRSIKRMWSRTRRGADTYDSSSAAAATADSASASAASASGGQQPQQQLPAFSSSETISSDEDDIIVQVEGVELEDAPASSSSSSSSNGGDSSYSRTDWAGTAASTNNGGVSSSSSSRGAVSGYDRYDAAAVLDVGMSAGGGDGGQAAAGVGGVRVAPELPPHVTVISGGDWGKPSLTSSSNGSNNGNENGYSYPAAGNVETRSSTWGSSSSSNGRSNGNVTHADSDSSSSSNRSGRGAAAWPQGSYGTSHPAASPVVIDVVEAVVVSEGELTSAMAAGAALPAERWQGSEARPATGGQAPGPVTQPGWTAEMATAAVPVAGAAGAGPEAVAAVAAVATTKAPMASVAVPGSRTATGGKGTPLPFIEDEILYVPAGQWGKSGDAAVKPSAAAVAVGTAAVAAAAARPSLGQNAAAAQTAAATAIPPQPQSALQLQPTVVHAAPAAPPDSSGSHSAAAGSGAAAAVPATASTAGSLHAGAAGPAAAAAEVRGSAVPPGGGHPAASPPSAPVPSHAPSPAAVHPAGNDSAGAPTTAASTTTANAHTSAAAPAAATSSSSSSPGPAGPFVATASASSSSSRGAAGTASSDEGATSLLVGSVDVAVTVMVPSQLAAVPRPLLGMTGSLIARYAISSLLPSFLDLLAADYGRWSTGQTVAARAAPAGDLAAVAVANAAARGATPPSQRSSAQQAAAGTAVAGTALAASKEAAAGVTSAGGGEPVGAAVVGAASAERRGQ